MHVIRVTPEEYEKIVPDRRVFFNEPRFCELNKDKVDQVHYLIVMKDTSARFGLILGQKGDVAKCPFSAPYSYPVEVRGGERVAAYDEALQAIEAYCAGQGIRELFITFPPLFYDEHVLSAWISAFYRNKYEVANLDLTYALDLKQLNVDVEQFGTMVTQKGRKALRKAMKSGLTLHKCETYEEMAEAYEMIKINHDAKGFPVRMTFQQVMDTMKLVDHDVFLVKHGETTVLAEFLYRVNKDTVQGIYCGVHPDYTEFNSMNYLTYQTIRYYGDLGYKILDKATATENSIPNYGLCDFKESVGAKRSLKYSFHKNLAD